MKLTEKEFSYSDLENLHSRAKEYCKSIDSRYSLSLAKDIAIGGVTGAIGGYGKSRFETYFDKKRLPTEIKYLDRLEKRKKELESRGKSTVDTELEIAKTEGRIKVIKVNIKYGKEIAKKAAISLGVTGAIGAGLRNISKSTNFSFSKVDDLEDEYSLMGLGTSVVKNTAKGISAVGKFTGVTGLAKRMAIKKSQKMMASGASGIIAKKTGMDKDDVNNLINGAGKITGASKSIRGGIAKNGVVGSINIQKNKAVNRAKSLLSQGGINSDKKI